MTVRGLLLVAFLVLSLAARATEADPWGEVLDPSGPVAAAGAPDGSWIAFGLEDQTILVYEAEGGRLLRRLRGSEAMVTRLSFGPDSSFPTRDAISRLEVSPDGRRLAALAEGGSLRVWDPRTGESLQSLSLAYEPTDLAFSGDGRRLAAVASSSRYLDNDLRIWDAEGSIVLAALADPEPHSGSIHVVALNHDGTVLATSGADETIALWRVADGTLLRRLDPGARVSDLRFTHDGSWVVASAEDGVKAWDRDFRMRTVAPPATGLRVEGSLVSSLHDEGGWRSLDLVSGAVAEGPDLAGAWGLGPRGTLLLARGRNLLLVEAESGRERARFELAPAPLPGVRPAEPPQAGGEWTNPRDGSVLIFVSPGPFMAGPDEARRRVDLPGFWIGRYEVTNEQFARFLNEVGNRRGPDGVAWHWLQSGIEQDDSGRFRPVAGLEQHPVTDASYWGARAYALWAGLRLPTEDEWEKAARGTDARTWPWGDTWDPARCTWAENNLERPDFVWTRPVGALPAGASPYGCQDMAGNAAEWCLPVPLEPEEGEVPLRGGSDTSSEEQVTTFARFLASPGDNWTGMGFRVAR